MTSIISDSPAHSTGTDPLREKPTFEQDVSIQQVSLEWIQRLPAELKDAALFRFCKMVEARATLCESFALNQVLYRTISGNTFTESAESVAARTECDRKTILKGLHQAVEQNILQENKRPGTSNEYSFKPVEEWLTEPVVHNKDIRNNKIIEFPKTQNTESSETKMPLDEDSGDGVVPIVDDPKTDSNTVIVINLLDLEQQQEVKVPAVDTPTIWIRNPDATRYCQIPPIYDQNTGVEIQRQMEQEGLTAQKVVGRAIALTKVPLMLLELLVNIGMKLHNSFFKSHDPTPKPKDEVSVLVSLHLSKTLEVIGVKSLLKSQKSLIQKSKVRTP